MALPLHIFEPRYRKMMAMCRAGNSPFGIVLIRSGVEVGGSAIPYPVGTMARVSKVQDLPDGRINVEALGQERFRILTLHESPEGYLTATVKPFPLEEADNRRVERSVQALSPWLLQYLELLSEAARIRLDKSPLPVDPAALAYLAAIVAQIPMNEKQELLSVRTLAGLLQRERIIYRREISLLRAMLNSAKAHDKAAFSPN